MKLKTIKWIAIGWPVILGLAVYAAVLAAVEKCCND